MISLENNRYTVQVLIFFLIFFLVRKENLIETTALALKCLFLFTPTRLCFWFRFKTILSIQVNLTVNMKFFNQINLLCAPIGNLINLFM